jgi:hypothetical protein
MAQISGCLLCFTACSSHRSSKLCFRSYREQLLLTGEALIKLLRISQLSGSGPDQLVADLRVSPHRLNRPEAQRFRIKFAKLNVSKMNFVEAFFYLLKAQ